MSSSSSEASNMNIGYLVKYEAHFFLYFVFSYIYRAPIIKHVRFLSANNSIGHCKVCIHFNLDIQIYL
ncbi:hypothetical protein BY458DRAFT_512133 [Sporodiniella umbellata]|nr:hypothetical protein BY458DRAFT_512133 [Sporodiniella umbellata]